jgi:hypothetical protein
MIIYVVITNPGWFKYNRQVKNNTAIFWRKSKGAYKFFKEGDLMLFLLKGHLPRYVRGCGEIGGFGTESVENLWNMYGNKMGSENIEGVEARMNIRRDEEVGFYVINNIVYLPMNKWINDDELEFAKDIEIGKKYADDKVNRILSLLDKIRSEPAIESGVKDTEMKKYQRIKGKKSCLVFKS